SLPGATGTYTSGGVFARSGAVSNAVGVFSSGTLTAVRVTSANHGLSDNNLVTLTNAGTANGTYKVHVVDANTFDLIGAGSGSYQGSKGLPGVYQTFTVSDPDNLTGDPATGLGPVTATSDNTTLVPTNKIAVDGTGTNRVLLYNVAANTGGVANVTIHVSD